MAWRGACGPTRTRLSGSHRAQWLAYNLANLETFRSSQLDVFFQPKSVAVIGASETAGSVGRSILFNLISSPFGGTVYPVNPKRASVLGIRAYPNIAAVPEPVELAVVITRAETAPATIRECAAAGVK